MKSLILTLALVCIAVQAAPTDKPDCSKLEEVIDDLGVAQGMSTMNAKYKLATNKDEFATRCAEMAEAIKTLRKYNKECYSGLTQQVFSAILRTRSQMNEARCGAGSPLADETIEATKCLQDNAFKEVQQAEKKTIADSQAILDANIPDEKMRTRRACCSVLSSRKNFIDATKSKCAKHEALYGIYIDSYTSEAMGLICPEESKLECDKLEVLKAKDGEPANKSFLNPMLKLVKTLDH